nr:nucleoside triphosphate pyrophosphohydrolase [Rhodospirillum rubrum]
MARLRDPLRGCPWDRAQTFASLAPHTLEEAYEVVDAIERGARSDLRDELGDLLLQVVFHARLAEEEGAFDFDAVATAIADKLEHRHPHIFGESSLSAPTDAAAQTTAWEEGKARDRQAQAAAEGRVASVLDGVTATLPALARAHKLGTRVARVGFDWPDIGAVVEKLHEELGELQEELAGRDQERIIEEMGDLLFVVVQLARSLDVDSETALRRANAKFDRRFRHVESRLAESGRGPADSTLEEMEELWRDAKRRERGEPT